MDQTVPTGENVVNEKTLFGYVYAAACLNTMHSDAESACDSSKDSQSMDDDDDGDSIDSDSDSPSPHSSFSPDADADSDVDIPTALQRRCNFDVAAFVQRIVHWHRQNPEVLTAYAEVPEIIAGGQTQGAHPSTTPTTLCVLAPQPVCRASDFGIEPATRL